MQASQIPTLVPLAFAANGTKNTIPESSQIGITNGAASLNDGFPPLTFTPVAAGGVPPFGADFNGVLNLITQTIRWKHAGGQFGYNSTFANDTNVGGYPRGALLLRSDQSGMWLNQTDSNASNPDTGGAGWSAAFMSGAAGQMRNFVMNVAAASASATAAADEIVVGSALGAQKYVLGSFSKTINLAATGAGGMDTGAAPTSGYVAIYAIYNPTTQTAALLATNATSVVAPTIYGGANMPSGYTASALVSVWPTNPSGQFIAGNQYDRQLDFVVVNVLNTTTATNAALSIASVVPKNAKIVKGFTSITSSASGNFYVVLTPTAAQNFGQVQQNVSASSGAIFYQSFSGLMVIAAQSIYYALSSSGGTTTFVIGISGYSI